MDSATTRPSCGLLCALLPVVSGLAAFLLLYVLRCRLPHTLPLPPAPLGLPIIGETLLVYRAYRNNKYYELMRSRVAKYGHIFRSFLLFQNVVFIDGAEANRFVYSNEGTLVDVCWPRSLTDLIGENSLLRLEGAKHKRMRRLIAPSLSPTALQATVATVDKLTRQHFGENWLGLDQVTLYPLVTSHILNVTTTALTNVCDPNTVNEIGKEVAEVLYGLTALPLYIPGTTFYKAHAARARLANTVDVLISEREEEMKAGKYDREFKDTLSILMNAEDDSQSFLTRKEINDTMVNLLIASNDTTVSLTYTVCRLLGEHAECYEEVLKEQKTIAESLKAKNQAELGWADLLEMHYTWAVVQESMRIQPVSPGTFRVAKEDTEFGGFRIPKGWQIFNGIALCQADEKYFPHPNKFDPRRFLNGNSPAPYTYTPFGGGSHVCPGAYFVKMVVLVFLHHLCLNFRWTALNPNERIVVSPLPHPQDGFPIKIHSNNFS